MPESPTAVDVTLAVAAAFEIHGISYAIGGALALGFYAPPRATVDVDVNAFVPPEEGLDALLAALDEIGFQPDTSTEAIRVAAAESGQFRGRIRDIRVDVFVPAIPYYGELEARRRRVVLMERPIWIIGPEDLAVLKLMFFRRKDLADVEAILRDQGAALDRAYIRQRLVEFVGDRDERLTAFADIEHDVDGAR